MKYTIGMEVKYRDMCGVIDFICDRYVVLQLPSTSVKHQSPRVLIYQEHQDEIIVFKDSDR